MILRLGLLMFAVLLFGAGQAAITKEAIAAEETKPAAESDLGEQVTSKRVLTAEEKAEKLARRACKIEICDILATKEPQGPDIACDIVKTWRADDIVKMLGGRINWPWGKAVCQSKLRLKRAPLAKAMSAGSAKVEMEQHGVRCSLYQDGGKPYVVEIAMSPAVTFKNGKATKAQINWGEVSAPMLIYPLLYAGTGLDNSSNVLGPEVVRMVNEFTGKECAKVKDELPGRRVN